MKRNRIPMTIVGFLLLTGSPVALAAETDKPDAKIAAAIERYEEMSSSGRLDRQGCKPLMEEITKAIVANPTDKAVPEGIEILFQVAHGWLNDRDLISSEIFDILGKHYLNDEGIDPIINWMTQGRKKSEKIEKFLLEVAGKSERPAAQTAHLFTKARLIEDDPDKREEYRSLLTKIIEDYPEVSLYNTNVAELSQSKINQLTRKVGMKAPEIVGKDVDGNELKLSDYRGKIVVLRFWGDW